VKKNSDELTHTIKCQKAGNAVGKCHCCLHLQTGIEFWRTGLYGASPSSSGATGFDRMVSVKVACLGCSIGPVKNSSKILTANNNDVAGRVGFAAPVRMAA